MGFTMHKVFLALGANVGNRERNINLSIKLLKEKIKNVRLAPIYESKAVGYKDQANFLNTALLGFTALSPLELLDFIKKVEKKVGRIKRFKWGPREIDIDILFYENLIYKEDKLQIPHPRLHERDFVLQPLLDLEPQFEHPVFKKTVKKLLEESSQVKSIIQRI